MIMFLYPIKTLHSTITIKPANKNPIKHQNRPIDTRQSSTKKIFWWALSLNIEGKGMLTNTDTENQLNSVYQCELRAVLLTCLQGWAPSAACVLDWVKTANRADLGSVWFRFWVEEGKDERVNHWRRVKGSGQGGGRISTVD